MKLGIVGHGFVGSAVNQGFTKNTKKYIVDPKYYSSNTIESLIQFKPDATFVAVHTPMLETGECNTDILESILQKLNDAFKVYHLYEKKNFFYSIFYVARLSTYALFKKINLY